MAITSIGFSGTVLQDGFSKLDGGGYGDGILGSVPGSSALRVDRVVGADRRVTIQPGECKTPGVRANNSAVATYDLPANSSGSPRLDWIVARFSWASSPGTVVLTHVQGTPAATPSRPALVQTAGVQWDLPLALVRVDAGVGALPADAVTDARYWEYNGITAVVLRLIDPPHRPGRLLYVSSTGELLTSNGSSYLTAGPSVISAALPLQSGWAAYGTPQAAPSYAYTSDGAVVLAGMVKRTGAGFTLDIDGTQIATLPAAARPSAGRTFLIASFFEYVRLDLAPTGVVTMRRQGSVAFTTGGWVSLDGVTFRR